VQRGADRRLLHFLALNGAVGVAAGWLVLGCLFRLNVGQLRDLLAKDAEAWLWLLLAGAGFAVTFGGVAMATAVFLLSGRR
jgi:hypothetical protein